MGRSPGARYARVRRPVASAYVERAVLIRYRVMAYVTATLLAILVFVGIPLQLAANKPEVVNTVGTIHGFCYMVYLVVAFDFTRKLRVPIGRMVLVLLAGTIPFCSIVAERKLTKLYDRQIGPDGGATEVGGVAEVG